MLQVVRQGGHGGKAAERLDWRWNEDDTYLKKSVDFVLVLKENGFCYIYWLIYGMDWGLAGLILV